MGLLVVPGRWGTGEPVLAVWEDCNLRPFLVLIIVTDVLKICIGLDDFSISYFLFLLYQLHLFTNYNNPTYLYSTSYFSKTFQIPCFNPSFKT